MLPACGLSFLALTPPPLQVVSKLHSLLKPFMLRRLKADVEICLPRKQEVLLYAPMSEQQQTINSQLLEKTLGVSRGCCSCWWGCCWACSVCFGCSEPRDS